MKRLLRFKQGQLLWSSNLPFSPACAHIRARSLTHASREAWTSLPRSVRTCFLLDFPRSVRYGERNAMAAAARGRLGLQAQDRVPRHRMLTRVISGTTYYEGSNGLVFRVVRTLSNCLAGHMLLVVIANKVRDPATGSERYVDTAEQRAVKRLIKYNLEHCIR